MVCEYSFTLAPCNGTRTVIVTIPNDLVNSTLHGRARPWTNVTSDRSYFITPGRDFGTLDTVSFHTSQRTQSLQFSLESTPLYDGHSPHEISAWCDGVTTFTNWDTYEPEPKANTIMQAPLLRGWSFGEGLGILFLCTWLFLIVYYGWYFCWKHTDSKVSESATELVGVDYHEADTVELDQ